MRKGVSTPLQIFYSEHSTDPMKKVLDFYVEYYSHYHGLNVSLIVEKLKVVSELQKILLAEPEAERESKSTSPESTLRKLNTFKDALIADKSLEKHRHKTWDTFVAAIFFIITSPVSIPYSMFQLCRGKKDFTSAFMPNTYGKSVKQETIEDIDKLKKEQTLRKLESKNKV